MKKSIFVVIMAMAMFVMSNNAQATPKYVEMSLPAVSGNNVSLGSLPAGYQIVDVVIYDDVRGIPGRSIGSKTTFELRPGEGFNFVVRHPDGQEYWQMITPRSPVGRGLWVDCQDSGCKYYRPMPNEKPSTQR